jgi:hypothetical protein
MFRPTNVDLQPINYHTSNKDNAQRYFGACGEMAMSTERVWNDEARDQLRATLRSVIRGEIRLAKRDHEDILQLYREVYIDEDCPESERGTFLRFAADELQRAVAQLAVEKAAWPEETDCDRLDRVEAALRDRSILLWQASPCCDTCTGAELPDRIDEIDGRYPGFRDHVRGYSFFIDQNLPEMLAESTELSVYLAYGWFSREDGEVAPEVYEKNALGIAREVCQCLRDEGFEVDWNGNFARKIGISLDWQRRTMLD